MTLHTRKPEASRPGAAIRPVLETSATDRLTSRSHSSRGPASGLKLRALARFEASQRTHARLEALDCSFGGGDLNSIASLGAHRVPRTGPNRARVDDFASIRFPSLFRHISLTLQIPMTDIPAFPLPLSVQFQTFLQNISSKIPGPLKRETEQTESTKEREKYATSYLKCSALRLLCRWRRLPDFGS